MKRIAGIVTFASLAFIAYACAHLELHLGAPSTPIALHEVQDEALVSNGIDGGRPPAEHVDD
jgi:hypothetical protein